MDWDECIKEEIVFKRTPDFELAKSLVKTALTRLNFTRSQTVTDENCRFLVEGYYDSVLELVHAFLVINGFRAYNHECAIEFLKIKGFNRDTIEFLHQLRKLRNAIKYYGRSLDKSSALEWINNSFSTFNEILKLVQKELNEKTEG